MISKNDIVLLLTELEDNGIDIGDNLNKLFRSPSIPLSIIKFINDNRQLDLTTFYENLRKNYNKKKSKLYISIVRENADPRDAITTLSSSGLQVALYASKLEDPQLFLRHARAKEVNLVLAKYYTDYDLTNCVALLNLIKADLVACETIEGRRE